MESSSGDFKSIYSLPIFKFGPYVTIQNRGDVTTFDEPNCGLSLQPGTIGKYSEQDSLRRYLDRQPLPGDTLLETPSLVSPFLLKKRTKWPADAESRTSRVEDESILMGPQVKTPTGQYRIIKVKTTDEDSSKQRDNARPVEDYIKSLAVATISKRPLSDDTSILSVKDFYSSKAGEMLLGIGLSQAMAFNLENDIKKIMLKIKKGDNSTEMTRVLEAAKAQLKQAETFNETYNEGDEELYCPICNFRSKSNIVMASHMEVPHKDSRGEHRCNWCDFKTKDSASIIYHTNKEHRRICRIERPLLKHQCPNCDFETRDKRSFGNHFSRCQDTFNFKENLAPVDDDFPGITSKPITRTDCLAYEQALNSIRRSSLTTKHLDRLSRPLSESNNRSFQQRTSSININGLVTHPPPRISTNLNTKVSKSCESTDKAPFVVCEICDCYITNLDELKFHMQSLHKVRIHHKMLASKPPLCCQKCQWRFYTDQGLERHLLGAHGLVSHNLQEKADKGLDSGRCTVCGRAFANKLVAHVKEVHKTTLKSAHLSYKCTVCSATFNLYRLFENHVYNIHRDKLTDLSNPKLPLTNGHAPTPPVESIDDDDEVFIID